jgi:plastocyanin
MKILILLLSLASQSTFSQSFDLTAFKVVANCNQQDYVDVIPGNAPFTVVTQGASYSPKCLRVKKGTSLNIQASSRHPLQGIPDSTSDLANPIYDELGGAVTTKTYTFNDVGVFGYYCIAHGNDLGEGMAAAILVVE